MKNNNYKIILSKASSQVGLVLLLFILCKPCHAQLTKRWFLNNGKSLNFDYEPPRLERGSKINFPGNLSTRLEMLNSNDQLYLLIDGDSMWRTSGLDTNVTAFSGRKTFAFERCAGGKFVFAQKNGDGMLYNIDDTLIRYNLNKLNIKPFWQRTSYGQCLMKQHLSNEFTFCLIGKTYHINQLIDSSYFHLRKIVLRGNDIVSDTIIDFRQAIESQMKEHLTSFYTVHILDVTNNGKLIFLLNQGRLSGSFERIVFQLVSMNLFESSLQNLEILQDYHVVKRFVMPDGSHSGWDYPVRVAEYGKFSPNDSFFIHYIVDSNITMIETVEHLFGMEI